MRELATRGGQIILLTQTPLNDPFFVDYIEDLRSSTNNELITAEQVNLASLHSIRTFATKWIDNAPPRRLDMIVLCGNTMTPRGGKLQTTEDEVEINWGVNYLANFHLLSILSPAIRAQPPDREIRVLVGTCVSYLAGELPVQVQNDTGDKSKEGANQLGSSKQAVNKFSPGAAYASSKLALMTFAHAFQKHLSSHSRPDKQPMNARIILVDPGFTRTPGMRRYLTWGSLTGLFVYLVTYPFWWLILKSPNMGAQSFLYAAMEAQYGRGEGGWLIKECTAVDLNRADVRDEQIQAGLWKYSENMVQEAEKRGALARAKAKKDAESTAKAKPEEKPANEDKRTEASSKQTTSRRNKKPK